MKRSSLPKVLMFGWEFPPFNSGGLGVACEGLSKALSASGLSLTFSLPIKVNLSVPWCDFVFGDDYGHLITEKDLKVLMSGYPTSLKESREKTMILNTNLSYGSLLQRVFRYADRARLIALAIDHDVIHVHDWLCFPAGILAKQASGKPLIVHVHAVEFNRSGGDNVNKEVFEIEKLGMEMADKIVAVSQMTKNHIVQKYGIDPNKVQVIHNGVEFENNHKDVPELLEEMKAMGSKIVLFAGRITLQKGPDYFVALAHKVLQYEPNTYFVVAGNGDMEEAMMREVAGRGMADKFLFCGFLRGAELSKIFKAADIYVMPSVSEPFGILPLEVMLSDTPVLISKESGVSEVVTSALKSNFWDIDDMTDKVVSVLRHKSLKNHLSYHGKIDAKGIHWKKAADSCISLYNSLVNTK